MIYDLFTIQITNSDKQKVIETKLNIDFLDLIS